MTESFFIGGPLAGRMAKVPGDLQFLTYNPEGTCSEPYVRHHVTYLGHTKTLFAPNHVSPERIHEMWLTMDVPLTYTELVFIHRAGDLSAQCFLPKEGLKECPQENSSITSSPPSARCETSSGDISGIETPLPYELL